MKSGVSGKPFSKVKATHHNVSCRTANSKAEEAWDFSAY